MPLAIGGSAAPSRPPKGAFWVDVRDYGAIADNGHTDNSGPFQAAIDDLAARLKALTYPSGVVFIPGATKPYGINKPVYVDQDNITIQGEGTGTVILMAGGCHSVFIFGVRRVQQALINGNYVPLTIDASNRPDLFGKLDASAAPTPGASWGLRTNGNSFVQFHAGPMSCGVSTAASATYLDNWSETSKLTLEFCIEPPDGKQFLPFTPILGMGGHNPVIAAPFVVSSWDAPNKFSVMFRTSDLDSTGIRAFNFTLGAATQPFRIALQFDLDNAVLSAFVNGVQIALAEPNNLSPTSNTPFAPGLGLKFAPNEHHPFLIGADGINGTYNGSTGTDLRVYGLRLSNTIRYQNNGPGQRQVRADTPSTPINDAWAYFGYDSNTVCFLAGADNPATAGRMVSVRNGRAVVDGLTSGLFIHSVYPINVANNAIRDLTVVCQNGFGQGISIGAVLEMTVEGVKSYGGYHGIGSINTVVSYFLYIYKCNLQGTDSAYYGAFQLMYARDINIESAGRNTIRHLASGSRWDNVLISRGSPVTECAFKACAGDYGGDFILSNWVVDFEGESLTRAAIYCEAHGQTPATGLNLLNVFLGTIGTGKSLVQLKDTSPENPGLHKCWLKVDNLQAYTNDYLGAFDVDGPLWYGEVKGVALDGPRLHHRQKWGAKTNLAIFESKYVAPPRVLPWYGGAHILHVPSPAEGQFAEWRSVDSGAYGTPIPPTWAGLNPVSVSKNGLAGYVLNHAYMTANLS